MSASNNEGFSRTGDRLGSKSDRTVFSAPIGDLKSGRLVVNSGAERVSIAPGPAEPHLYQARFSLDAPHVWVQEDLVTLTFNRLISSVRLANLDRPPGEILLNGSIPWEIEFRKGVSALVADLVGLKLRSLDILGGADQIRLLLSRPSGSTFIYISGGVNSSLIQVPASTGIRVQVSGGSTNLAFEGQRFRAIGGETDLQSTGYEEMPDRYDIRIAGGTNNLTISRNEKS